MIEPPRSVIAQHLDHSVNIGACAYVQVHMPGQAVGVKSVAPLAAVPRVENGRAYICLGGAGSTVQAGFVVESEVGAPVMICGRRLLWASDAVEMSWRRWAQRD